MAEEQIKNNSNNIKIIVLTLLLFLNGMLFFLYKSIPFELPPTIDLSLTSKALIENVIFENIKNGLSNGLLLLSLDGTPYSPESNINDWKKENPLHLIFPEGKIRYDFNIFQLKTFNKNLSFNATLTIDTLYQGAGSFGFGVIDNLEEYIYIKNNHANLYNGAILIEQFNNKDNTWIPTNNTSLQLTIDSNSLFIENKYGTVKEFVKNSDNIYILKSYSDKMNNTINFKYDSNNKVSKINFNEIYQLIKRNEKGLIIGIESKNEEIKFQYDGFNNLISVIKAGNEFISLEHKSKTYPHKITSIKHDNELYIINYGLLGRIEFIKSKIRNLKINYGENVIQVISQNLKSTINFINQNKIVFNNDKIKYSYEYNHMKQLISYDTDNDSYKYEYSSNGNLTKKIINNDIYEFFYDNITGILTKSSKNGDILFEKIIENGVITNEFRKGFGNIQYVYNNKGQISKLHLESFGDYEIERNDKNLITKIIHPDKSFSTFQWEKTKLVKYSDVFGISFMFNFGRDGQLIEILNPTGKSNIIQNDSIQHLKILPNISTENVNIPSIDYNDKFFQIKTSYNENLYFYLDPFRRIQKVKYKDKFKNYIYDYNDLLSQIRFENNDEIYIENNEQRLTQNFLTGDGIPGQITFDESNQNMESIILEKDFHSFKYNKNNNIIQHSLNGAIKYNFSYGPKENLQVYQIEYPDKTTVNYSYDKNDKVAKIIFSNRDIVTFNYPRPNTIEIKYPNDVTQLEEYDDNNFLNTLSISDKTGASIRESNFFFKDGNFIAGSDNGKRIQISYNENQMLSNYFLQNIFDHEYTYSDDNELINIKDLNNVFTKHYDTNKDLIIIEETQKQLPISSINLCGKIFHSNFSFLEINGIAQEEKSQTFTAKNHPITNGLNSLNIKGFLANGNTLDQTINFYVDPLACSVYQLEKNGNLKYIHEDGKSSFFTWSALKQVKTFIDKNGDSYEYQYYPNGLLESMTKQGKTSYFIYDIFGNLIEEVASTGRSIIKYIYDYTRNKLILSFDGKNVLFYHTDAFGSVINITDKNSKNVAEYVYSPYGQVMYQKEQITNNKIGYLGMMKSLESGFYFTPDGIYNPDTILFFNTQYSSTLKPKKAVDFFINKNTKSLNKTTLISFKNHILETPSIPYNISFNKEFLWMNFVDVPEDMKTLKNYLTHKEKD